MNRFLKIILLIFLFFSPTLSYCFASEDTGVILVIDSSNSQTTEISEKVKNYLKLLRGINEPVYGKNIFWIKTYDYADETYIPFCTQILNVDKKQTPFVGISKLNDDYTFKEFIPGKSVSNITDPLDAAYKIMDFVKETVPSDTSKKIISRFTGIRSLASEPAGASVKIGGDFSGKAPAEDILLKPGKYKVSVTLDDYIPVMKEIVISEHQFDNINVKLEKINAFIELETIPAESEVHIDEQLSGKTPLTIKVIPGKHKITVTRQGYKLYEKTVVIENNSTIKKSVKLLPDKVNCYLECSGYYVKEFRKIDMHRSAEITRTIFSETLKEKLCGIIGKEKEITLVENKNNAEYIIIYEAWPEIPLRGKMKIMEIRNDKTLMEKNGKISISVRASDSDCAEKAAELFEKNLFPQFREYVEKLLQYTD